MYIAVRVKKCYFLRNRSKWISGCMDLLGGNLGKKSFILVCVDFVKKCCRRNVSVICYGSNFSRKKWSLFVLIACVTLRTACSRINDSFWILNNILECIKRCEEYVRWCLRSQVPKIWICVDKRRPQSMLIERLTWRELVTFPAREKYLSFSTFEGGTSNIMIDSCVSIGNFLCCSPYQWRTFLCLQYS